MSCTLSPITARQVSDKEVSSAPRKRWPPHADRLRRASCPPSFMRSWYVSTPAPRPCTLAGKRVRETSTWCMKGIHWCITARSSSSLDCLIGCTRFGPFGVNAARLAAHIKMASGWPLTARQGVTDVLESLSGSCRLPCRQLWIIHSDGIVHRTAYVFIAQKLHKAIGDRPLLV